MVYNITMLSLWQKGGVMKVKVFIKKFVFVLIVTSAYILSLTNITESETLNITTYYPAPYGGYVSMLTTNNTWLARNGGGVAIRTASTAAPAYPLTIGATGGVLGIENTASFAAKNAAGTYETFMWPRWSDNIMYINYGTGGFNIRNNSSVNTMFMTNTNEVGIRTTPSSNMHLHVNGNIRIDNGNFYNLCHYVWYGNGGTTSCDWGVVAGFISNAAGTNISAQLYPSGAWTVFTAESTQTGWLVCCRMQ